MERYIFFLQKNIGTQIRFCIIINEEEDTIIRSWEKVNFQVAIVKFYIQWPHRLVPF